MASICTTKKFSQNLSGTAQQIAMFKLCTHSFSIVINTMFGLSMQVIRWCVCIACLSSSGQPHQLTPVTDVAGSCHEMPRLVWDGTLVKLAANSTITIEALPLTVHCIWHMTYHLGAD